MRKLVPQTKIDDLPINFQVGGEVIKYGGLVPSGELILCVTTLT